MRGTIPRRCATYPRADRHRAQTYVALPQANPAGNDERRAGKCASRQSDRQPGRDRGWSQHRHFHGGIEEFPSAGRALYDPNPQVQHAMVSSTANDEKE